MGAPPSRLPRRPHWIQDVESEPCHEVHQPSKYRPSTVQTSLNKFHADTSRDLLVKAGYSEEHDAELLQRVRILLLKSSLARPPIPDPPKGLFGFELGSWISPLRL